MLHLRRERREEYAVDGTPISRLMMAQISPYSVLPPPYGVTMVTTEGKLVLCLPSLLRTSLLPLLHVRIKEYRKPVFLVILILSRTWCFCTLLRTPKNHSYGYLISLLVPLRRIFHVLSLSSRASSVHLCGAPRVLAGLLHGAYSVYPFSVCTEYHKNSNFSHPKIHPL